MTATPEPVVAPEQVDVPEPAVTVTATKEPTIAAPSKVKVPEGVGLNYQLAQDKWRAAGLIVMPAIDALDLDRMPWLDENWVVVSQSPKAGKRVKEGSEITATIKKNTD